MKNISILLLLLISSAVIQSCSPKAFNPYSSFAAADYKTQINSSHLEVITANDGMFRSQRNTATYSVIRATDRETLTYVLISPRRPQNQMPRSSFIDRHYWQQSAVLDIESATALLDMIESNSKNWDQEMPSGEAKYDEFTHRAEQGIIAVKSGSTISPFFRYHVATTEQGSRFSLTFSDGYIVLTTDFRSQADIDYFRHLLSKALE